MGVKVDHVAEWVAEWQAQVNLYEQDSITQARVELDTGTNMMTSEGLARRNPADPEVPQIGDELAVERALIELGERLVRAAGEDLAALAGPR